MNLAAIDLNLLVAFEALFEERHVTRAGQRVGLAQSSMSNALTRLRHLLDDKLFVRSGQIMRPTPKASELAPAIGIALTQLRVVLDGSQQFDPKTARRQFMAGATDYGDIVLVPAIVAALRRKAPGIDLVVKPTTDRATMLHRLECGEIDVSLGGHQLSSPQTISHKLFAERYVCIHDSKRSGKKRGLSRREYLSRPHALFIPADDTATALPLFQGGPNNAQRVALRLPHVVAIPFAVSGTDVVATITERIAKRFAKVADLAISRVPFDIPAFDVELVQSRHRANEAPIRWLVDLIIAEARKL